MGARGLRRGKTRDMKMAGKPDALRNSIGSYLRMAVQAELLSLPSYLLQVIIGYKI